MSTKIKIFVFIILVIVAGFFFLKKSNNNTETKLVDDNTELNNSIKETTIEYLNIYSSHAPVDLIITNNIKQRLGENSLTNEKYREILNAYQSEEGYESEGSEDFYPQVISMFENPITGTYSIQVIGLEDTDYSLYVSSDTSDGAKNAEISSTIKKGEMEEFVAILSKDGSVSIEKK